MAPTHEEVAAAAARKRRRPIIVLAIEGAYVSTRPESARGSRPGRKKTRAKRARWQGAWREAKGFRFYLVDAKRIVHTLNWHQIQDDEALFAALRQVKEAELIPADQVRLGVVTDGAQWIWARVTELFPTVREILDYYQRARQIHRVATMQYADPPQQALEWAEATRARLFLGEVDKGIGGLKRRRPSAVKAGAEIDNLITYLRTNRHRISYRSQRQGGYPLSSGGIESAHNFICHVRRNRLGAWWYVANGNHRLALRCATYTGTFDRVCGRYQQKILAQSPQKNVKK